MLLFGISLILLLGMNSVFATSEVGIGIKWSTDTEVVPQGNTTCLSYGIYNPFDTPVMGFLTAKGNLTNLTIPTEPVEIPAYTYANKSIKEQLCFAIPNVYGGNWLTGLSCPSNPITYKGAIVAAYTLPSRTGSGTGSATGTSFAAPLTLIVGCDSRGFNIFGLIAIVVTIAAISSIACIKYNGERKRKKKAEDIEAIEALGNEDKKTR